MKNENRTAAAPLSFLKRSPELHTSRLLLRPFCLEDAASVYQYASDPEIGWNCGWPPHTSPEDSRQVLQNVLMVPGTWAITLAENPSHAIGSIALLDKDHANAELAEGELELGFWIGRPYWNQGYVSEAAFKMKEYAFETLNASALVAGYASFNSASGKVQSHLGMEKTGEQCFFVESLQDERTVVLTRLENPRT